MLLCVVASAYAIIGLLMMLLASPKVPYADSWRFLAHFLETPFPANVFVADNGHREVLPNLVRVAELHWFDANQWLQIAVGMVLALATVATLVRGWRDGERTVRTAATALVCVAVFWLGNGRKLAHGSESVNLFLVLLSLVVGLRLLVTLPRDGGAGRVVGAAGLGLVATLSFGSGIACFVAFGAVLLLQRAPFRHWLTLGVGAGLAAAALLLGGGGEAATFGFAPGEQCDLLLRWLGAPFVWALSPLLDPEHAARMPTGWLREPMLLIAVPIHDAFGPHLTARWPALAFGAAGFVWLVIASLLRWRRPDGRSQERLALGLAWFGCAAGVLVVAVRLTFFRTHQDQIVSQRYVPWSMMFWTGLLLAFLLREGRSVRTAAGTVLFVAALLAPSQVWTGRYAWKTFRTAELTALGASVGVLDRAFPLVETDAKDLLHVVPLLRAAKKAVFAWPETQALGTRPGSEALLPVTVQDVEVARVQNWFGPDGWAVKFRAEGAAAERLLLLDGTGTACGLAIRTGPDKSWEGWMRSEIAAPELRAGALR